MRHLPILCSVQYIPARGERVVGVIVQTGAKQYRVDIGAHSLASLPELSFEGATKRNKPNLQVGSSTTQRTQNCRAGFNRSPGASICKPQLELPHVTIK